ncbi:hypothetical protein ACIQBJ_30675 [Kitasatospora sp. NPDC088391]|uniref:hypothetical protein n=1 Tax=Kitasatospora sp. NPDC088391 TaxID=3364074 RepID=UPI003825ADC2
MADGFRVDTDELEAVVKRLRTIQQNMAQTADRSTYGTAVTASDFGSNFSQATDLHAAHERMQAWLTLNISNLNKLINEFGDKTQTAHNAYAGHEADKAATMAKFQQRLD